MPPRKLSARPQTAKAPPAPKKSSGRVSRRESDVYKETEPPPRPQSAIVKSNKEAWLDNLPPVIKIDEELHQQLTKARKEAKEKRRINACKVELEAILEFAFLKLETHDDSYTIKHARIDFDHGVFQDKIEEKMKPKAPKRQIEEIPLKKGSEIKDLLNENPVDILSAMKTLAQNSLTEQFDFDVNSVIDDLLSRIHTESSRYNYIIQQHEEYEFNFLICMVMPPCTGKSTILQYFTSHFKLKVIDYNAEIDEKAFISSIIQTINSNLGYGFIVNGFPESKNQLSALDKALHSNYKQKKSEVKISSIGGMIKSSMTYDEAKQNTEKRIKSKEGVIYHPDFNPPLKGIEIEEDPYVESDNQEEFDKLQKSIQSMENRAKKYGPFLAVGSYQFVGELYLELEQFLNQLYKNKKPYESLVVFAKKEDFFFSQFCSIIEEIWNEKCVSVFGKPLGELYNRLEAIKNKISYLSDMGKQQYALLLARPDDRIAISREFEQNHQNPTDFYHSIWQKSVDIRDSYIANIGDFVKASSLKSLTSLMEESELLVFDSLLKRYFIVDWFWKSFNEYISNQTVPEEYPTEPSIPPFQTNNLRILCSLMNLPTNYDSDGVTKSSNNLPHPKRVRRVSNSNSSLTFLQTPLVESRKTDKPQIKPFESKIAFGLDKNQNEARSREDSILGFLNFIEEKTDSDVTKKEALVMKSIFEYFSDEREIIDVQICSALDHLYADLAEMTQEMCSHEMETFSINFRKYKQGENVEKMFEMDTSFLRDRSLELYQKINHLIPKYGQYPNLDPIKLNKMYHVFKKNNEQIVRLTRILEVATEVEFTEEETNIIELFARMTPIADYIDVLPFIYSLADHEVFTV